MSQVVLRPCAEPDMPAVADIYGAEVLGGTASYELEPPGVEEMTARWRRIVERGLPFLVALRDGAVVGYAYAGPYHYRPGYRYALEDSIYVAPRAQRAGVGRMLLGEVIAISERLGYRQMIAVIGGGAQQPGSIGLHAALGFRRVGVEGTGFKHGRWLDTVLMQRALGAGNATLPEER